MAEPSQVWKSSSRQPDFTGLVDWLPAAASRWFICSVCRPATEVLVSWLGEHRSADRFQILNRTDFPITTEVDYPERVGADRLAAAVAANAVREPHQPAIVVDAGTAITVDAISGNGVFLGGLIFPGRLMALKALASADQLPSLDSVDNSTVPEIIGKSTEQAIYGGVYWSQLGAIREIVSRLRSEIGSDAVLLTTGGAIGDMTSSIDPQARFLPGLVLTGVALAAMQSASGPREPHG